MRRCTILIKNVYITIIDNVNNKSIASLGGVVGNRQDAVVRNLFVKEQELELAA
jgi:hypothetical protein